MSETYPISPATATSTANAAATATIAAIPGSRIEGITASWSYSGVPTAGSLTIKDGSTTIKTLDIIAGGPGFVSLAGFMASSNAALSATIAAGGSGIIGKVNLSAKRA